MTARLNEARRCSASSRRVPRGRHLLAAQAHSHQPPRLRTERAAESRRRSAPARDRWACAPASDPSARGAWKAAAAGDGVRMEVATHP